MSQCAGQIGPVAERDLPRVADVLARAFRDNPLNAAVVDYADPARRLRSNLHGMRPALPVARAQGQLLGIWASEGAAKGELSGALVGALPGGYPLAAAPLGARLRCLLGQGWRVARRWSEAFQLLDALHPTEPHAYLGTLGVAPECQRRGFGRALLAHWLAQVDRIAAPAYLETDRREHVRFYARQGFEVVGETLIFGALIWRMQRPPV
jgi:ribosomal protein S18 acetylase RimI-like enzyme